MNEPEEILSPHPINVNPSHKELLRFWSKVDKVSSPFGCWLWVGAKDCWGYGKFGYKGKTTRPHRFSWMIHNGDIPAGLWALHDCPGGDNPACVNPLHLFIGTHHENMRDMVSKGIQAKGIYQGLSKLDDGKVEAIRTLLAAGKSKTDIANLFCVSRKSILNVFQGKTWRHVKIR